MQQHYLLPRFAESVCSDQVGHSNAIPIDMVASQAVHASGLDWTKKLDNEESNSMTENPLSECRQNYMPSMGLKSKSLRQLRRACRRAVNRAFYQGQTTQLRELKQISLLMISAVPSLRWVKGEILKTIDCKEASGIAPHDNIPLTIAIQKELGRWDDFLRVVVQIISERNTTTRRVTCAKARLYDRYYTVLELPSSSGDSKVLYKVVAKDSTNTNVAQQFDQFYYDWSISADVQTLFKGGCEDVYAINTQTNCTHDNQSASSGSALWYSNSYQYSNSSSDNMNHLIREDGTPSDMTTQNQKTLGEILEDTVATESNGQHTVERDTGYDFSAVKSVLDYLEL